MSALLDLAARVEAATGADRELDRDIAIATFQGREDGGCLSRARKVILSHGAQPWNYEVVEISGVSLRTPEPYTASLDTAMTLVPEGMQWSVDSHHKLAGVSRYWDDPQHGPCCEEYAGEAATLALALTAAALKARGAAQ